MEDKSILLMALGDSTKLRIIDFLADNRLFDYSQKQIIEGSGISKKSFYDNFNDLLKLEILEHTRKVGKAKMYRLNERNAVVKSLLAFEWQLIKSASEKFAV